MIGFEAETANPFPKKEMEGIAVSCSKKVTENKTGKQEKVLSN